MTWCMYVRMYVCHVVSSVHSQSPWPHHHYSTARPYLACNFWFETFIVVIVTLRAVLSLDDQLHIKAHSFNWLCTFDRGASNILAKRILEPEQLLGTLLCSTWSWHPSIEAGDSGKKAGSFPWSEAIRQNNMSQVSHWGNVPGPQHHVPLCVLAGRLL